MKRLINRFIAALEGGIKEIDNTKLEKLNTIVGKELTEEQLKKLLRKEIALYFLNINKTLILFSLAIVGSILIDKYMIVIILIEFILTGLIRKYAGGIHLNKSICFFYALATYFLGYFCSVNINLSFAFRFFIFVICLAIMSLYSPRSIKVLEILKESYFTRKYKTLIIITVLFVLSWFVNSNTFKNLIIWIIFIQSINITPIVYKIFNVN